MKVVTDKMGNKEVLSLDYEHYKADVFRLIYKAVPNGEGISVEGPSDIRIDYDLVCHVRCVVSQVMADILSRGKASWCLCVNPDKGHEDNGGLFCFWPKSEPVRGFKVIPMVIRSRDVGIRSRHIRLLSRRLRRSRSHLADVSLLKYGQARRAIADRWGHALSWIMSDFSAFTDSCILLNECDRRLLGIRLCGAIEAAMNMALSKAGLDEYKVKIPTYSREELELSRQKYIEGKIGDEEFSDVVFLSYISEFSSEDGCHSD